MTFALDSNPSPDEIAGAINYLLANIGAGIPATNNAISNNTTTGLISNTAGTIIQYQYRYLDIKYADNPAGLNFSDNPYSRLYFGIRNSDSFSESTNPADYTWFQVTGGFGISNVLWIAVTGGRHVNFAVSQNAPDTNNQWMIAPVQAIDLDNPFARFNQYMTVRFATDSVGTGFSSSSTNKTYYGVYTSTDGSSSTDPTAYQWTPFAFGTTYNLYYRTFGGRNIQFLPSTYQPAGFIPFKNVVINLDVTTIGVVNSLGIVSQVPLIVQSPYQYLLVRYASDIYGTGITNNPTGLSYFGLQTSSVLTLDNNPADFTWFYAGGTFLTSVNLWVKTSANNQVQFSFTLAAPDATNWYNVTADTTSLDPYIDVLNRSGVVVTNVSSPTSGQLGTSSVGSDGTINLNLNPYGQGSTTGGFTVNIASTSSLTFDQFGRVQQAGNLDQIRYSSLLTHATAGQTAFTFSNAQPDQILVFRNGCLLTPITDYTRTSTTVTFANACALNDVIAIYYIRLIDGTTSSDKVPFVTSTQTLTNGQTIIPSSYANGSELLFINGALIVDTDYSYRGTSSGYILSTQSTGGTCTIVSFSFNNGGVLIFGENIAVTSSGTNNVVFPTSFYKNSSLIWLNGMLLRPTDDYTTSGSTSLVFSYNSVGFLSYSNQPTQFATFNSSGEASTSSVGSAGVLGYDIPIEIPQEKTILQMFQEMQSQIDFLKMKVERIEE